MTDGEGGRRRARIIGAAVAVAVAAVVAVVVLRDDGGDAEDRQGLSGAESPSATVPSPFQGQLSETAQELVDLLAKGEAGRYHAVYAVEGDPELTGGEITIEVWRDGERSRRDTRTVTDEGTSETAGISDGDTGVACQRLDDGPWMCAPADPAVGVADDITGSIRNQLLGAEVRSRDDEIDGRPARCFEFGTLDGEGEVCASLDGVVLRLGAGQTTLVLTDLDDDVPGSVFDPPAEG